MCTLGIQHLVKQKDTEENDQLRAMMEMCKSQPGPAKQMSLSRRDWGLTRAFGES